MPNNFRLDLGAEFTMQTKSMRAFGFDGVVYSKILEIVPHQTLVYTWQGGMGK